MFLFWFSGAVDVSLYMSIKTIIVYTFLSHNIGNFEGITYNYSVNKTRWS